MTGTQLAAVTSGQWTSATGFVRNTTTTLDIATSLYTSSSSQIPQADSVSINYTYGYSSLYLGSTNTSSADLAEYYVSGDKDMEGETWLQ